MKRKSKTDWARVKVMKDSEIDYSDIPPLEKDFFKKAVLWPGTKKQITLRLDPDVIDFFRKKGRGYQSMINAVLRKYVEAHGYAGMTFEPKKKASGMRVTETAARYGSGRKTGGSRKG